MTGVESLDRISDKETVENIQRIAEEFVTKLRPIKIILFGSFANGTYNEDSDFDFYIVVDDDRNVNETTRAAYRALINVKKRPVDIIVGTHSRFEQKGKSHYSLMVEGEVERDGILLYDKDAVAV